MLANATPDTYAAVLDCSLHLAPFTLWTDNCRVRKQVLPLTCSSVRLQPAPGPIHALDRGERQGMQASAAPAPTLDPSPGRHVFIIWQAFRLIVTWELATSAT
jgi:hypothetical protein